jgi:hypothetical protein
MNTPPAAQTAFGLPEARAALLRTARLCHPDWEGIGQVTLEPARAAEPWAAWKEEIFAPILRPKLSAMLHAATTGDGRAVEAMDRALDAELPAKLAAKSRHAGLMLVAAYTVPNGEKLWKRAKDRIETGEMPGHLASVIAVRAAAFHLPPLLVTGSYLLAEAMGAFGETPRCFPLIDDCLAGGAGDFVLRAA